MSYDGVLVLMGEVPGVMELVKSAGNVNGRVFQKTGGSSGLTGASSPHYP